LELQEFIDKVKQRPLPNNPLERMRVLAKELAEGATLELWGTHIYLFRGQINDERVDPYIEQRWNNQYPFVDLLVSNGYVETNGDWIRLTKTAFDLLEAADPSTIFISYRRKDSSAFALLVLARLKSAGLDAFLDLTLEPGEEWHKGLQQRIQSRNYFILLLGKETLASTVVQKEITWALQAGLGIIPIWHNGFSYNASDWSLSPELDRLLTNTHSIRVLEESALAYNNAIVELLNRFGITP
jgi:hypothetical protein